MQPKSSHIEAALLCIESDNCAADDLAWRIRGEFMEMPGLRLSLRQAQRLWSLDAIRCEAMLNALVDVEFLMRTLDGGYALRRGQP